MNIKRIISPQMMTNCYLIYNDTECCLVDAGQTSELIIEELKRINLPLKKIIFTHGHYDHTAAAAAIRERTGAELYISEEDAPMLYDLEKSFAVRHGAYQPVMKADGILGEQTDICGKKFKVIKTPGHSEGSVCLLCDKTLFSGDTLFCGTIGNFEPKNQEKMMRSVLMLKDMIDDGVSVFPGHDRETIMGTEKKYNPFLRNDYWK